MRFIKPAIFGILVFGFVVLVISFFIPSRIRIARTVRVSTNKEEVMKELADPVKWKDWYPGADSLSLFYDSGMAKGLILKDKPVFNFVLKEVKENEVTAYYDNGKEKIFSTWRVFPEVDSNNTTIQWYLDFYMGWYPWKKFSSLFYDKLYGSQMDSGLDRLKKNLESKANSPD
ncbi:MAG: hypothetical protein B6D37_04020 [Sphingobacteriales bacterium UTBCD1]|nr:MAG: hypothetical protein B6D37_04020 [Sphingobacteriales bacterium UTBCD1]